MSITQEMFRFVTVRRPDRAVTPLLEHRFVRDWRAVRDQSMLVQLFGSGSYPARLSIADTFATSKDFVDVDDPVMVALEPAVDFFRRKLEPGVDLEALAAEFASSVPSVAPLLADIPPDVVLRATRRLIGRLWDTFYCLTIQGFDRYTSTNYAADALRLYHVLRLLWLSYRQQLTTWEGHRFDDYELIVDLKAAATYSGRPGRDAAARSVVGSLAARSSFRTPLEVGAIKPPAVGDLLRVDQELRCYEEGEVADIISIMKGERRERTIRDLTRTTDTTVTESLSETEESTTTGTDERFALNSEAQNTASQSFGLEAGVNVTGKYGPVQVDASVNASYNTSKSSSTSTSSEYAKTVTEEATKRVKNSIKEISSVTILTEHQDTSLQGYNNEEGTDHISGIYRWVDKLYDAKLMNYGRRLMLSFNVPEPALYYRNRLAGREAEALSELEEPIHPSQLSRATVNPLSDTNPDSGFRDYQDLDEDNYARLAAHYDVSGLAVPPAFYITGSKAIVYPEAMEAKKLEIHDATDDLTWVSADNTLTIEDGYRLTKLAVFAPAGSSGGFTNYVNALDLGEVAPPKSAGDGTEVHQANVFLVLVGDKSFYMSVRRDPDDGDAKKITTNFNTWEVIDDDWKAFGDAVSQTIPISITAKFEGALNFTVMYQGQRSDEAFDAWRSQTWAAIMKGYQAKVQAYEQAQALAESQARAATEAETFTLRDDQYRSIELTELKRGCIELLTAGTAAGHTSVVVEADGRPRMVFDESEGSQIDDWRPPLANGAVAEFFEQVVDWSQAVYEFHPYYWAGADRWTETAEASGSDPVFEQFLRAGNASVSVPVRPGYERPALTFFRTSQIWGGGYLALFNTQEMLDVYADVELAEQIEPAVQVGETWEVRLPTNLIYLQASGELPKFPAEEPTDEPDSTEPIGLGPGTEEPAPF